MTFPSTLTDSELSAVNQILGAVGQAPVTTLDVTNPDVAIAYNVLIELNRELQAQGWTFNTELEYELIPDVNGNILLADTVLQCKLSQLPENQGIETVKRDGKLYNRLDHTYDWSTYESVKCDIIWLFSFDDCPQPFKDYVIAAASCQASSRMVGDPNQFRLLKDREAQTMATWKEYETSQGNYTMFGYPLGTRYNYTYQPFKAITR